MSDFNTDRQVTFQELVNSGQYVAKLIDEILRNAIELAEKLKLQESYLYFIKYVFRTLISSVSAIQSLRTYFFSS